MIYRNTKTGAVIESHCNVSGGDWVKDEPKTPKKKETSKKAVE